MTDKPISLADTAKRIREEAGYTLDQVESNSGGTITGGYVSKIENGQAGDVTVTKLLALAKGLRVLPQLLLDAAQGEQPKETIHISRAIAILRELSEADQKLAVSLVDVLRGSRFDQSVPPVDKMRSKILGRKGARKKKEAS